MCCTDQAALALPTANRNTEATSADTDAQLTRHAQNNFRFRYVVPPVLGALSPPIGPSEGATRGGR